MEKIRVLLVDDDAVVCNNFCALLAQTAGLEVVGEGAKSVEALEKATQLTSDVLLTDVAMSTMGGLEATSRITSDSGRQRYWH